MLHDSQLEDFLWLGSARNSPKSSGQEIKQLHGRISSSSQKVQACVHKNSKVEVSYDSQGAFQQETSNHRAQNSIEITVLRKFKTISRNILPCNDASYEHCWHPEWSF